MKLSRKVGSTSEIWQVFVRDSSSTTGAGLTGLAYNTGSLTAYYHRDTDATATAITLVTMTVGTFTSSGFKEVDATNMPGWYQFCPPNAALAAGAKSCGFHLKGAANMAPLPLEVDLQSDVNVSLVNGNDAVGMGKAVDAIAYGVVDAGSSTTVINIASITPAVANTALAGRVLLFPKSTSTAALRCQGGSIDTNTTTTITLDNALTDAPAAGDIFVIQ